MPAEVQSGTLNTDDAGKRTSSYFGDLGDAVSKWFKWTRVADGGDVAQGATDDTAITSGASSGSVIAILKGLLTILSGIFAAGYPYGATPVIAGASAANTSNAAALPAVSAKTNYIAGFEVTGSGATGASVISVTVAGLLGGTRTYKMVIPAGVTAQVTPLLVQFSPPLPASAVNTAITVTAPAFGAGNTDAAVVAHGFVV